MPELPEVETIKRDLSRLIVGKKILSIETDTPKQLQPSPAAVRLGVVGAKITKIDRRAKVILIHLDNSKILAVHLKLTGRLLFRKREDSPDDWVRVVIGLSGGQELRFADLRKFGWIKIISNHELRIMNHEFGPEALGELTLVQLKKILASNRRPVKVVLMDQKNISGIGNIYASDALFLAKIDPRRPANQISSPEAQRLHQAIKKVLQAGIRYRGASDQHYLDALGQKGSYQDHFLVYGKDGEACFQCGAKIKKIKLGGRGTAFCPQCQQ